MKEVSASITSEEKNLIEKTREKKFNIYLENGTKLQVSEYKAFWCKKQCYIWDAVKLEYSKLTGLDKNTYCSDLNLNDNNNTGLTQEEQILRRIIYGKNEIRVPVQSIGILFIYEVLNPFYIFQIFTLAVWIIEGYIYYCGAILCMSIFGIANSIIQTRKNQIRLKDTVASVDDVKVLRYNKQFQEISSSEIVPGDIIELPKYHGMVVCDAVLLTGSCIVNESMLTGITD